MAMAIALLILLVAAPAAFGAQQHVVGGISGWSQGEGVDYTAWASSQTFVVGDTLLFTYVSSHSVDVVSEGDYNNCSTSSPLNSYSGGNTIITLNSAGTMYFICPTPGHCQSGMKLSIAIGAATNAPNGSLPANTTPPPLSPLSSPPPPLQSSAATVRNFGGKKYVLVEFSLFVVALVGGNAID